jgi:prepilin-type N-terminal cleavage/methylation domain-containing protein
MKTRITPHRAAAGFTLVEVIISMTIVVMVLAISMSTFLFGLRTMYKDSQRLATNATLRYFMAQISKETLDASEFYLFPLYTTLDGNVNPDTDVTTSVTDQYDTELYHGDCLVLVTRTSLDKSAKVRQFRIYYRVVTDSNQDGAIRYYESKDYGDSGTDDELPVLLNAVNLKMNPQVSGSVLLTSRARGRPKGTPGQFYPIFSSEFPTVTPTNESVSLNVEFINGTSTNNLLSSSSFNYTISPRR